MGYEQEPKPKGKFKIPPPEEWGDDYYVRCQKPSPNDEEGQTAQDIFDERDYVYVGDVSRRMECWKTTKANAEKYERMAQDESRARLRDPSVNIPGGEVVSSTIEDLAPVSVQQLLGQ